MTEHTKRLFLLPLIWAFLIPINGWCEERASLINVLGEERILLEPTVAFAPSGRLQSGSLLSITFNIAKNYYLYRHAFKFSPAGGSIELGQPRIPSGKKTRDEWFGEVETYRGPTQIDIPYSFKGDEAPNIFYIEVGYQGCESILGVCYPPQKRLLEFIP